MRITFKTAEEEARYKALYERYRDAAHAMQSATALQIERLGYNKSGSDPKHLRVGVNSTMVETSSIVELLISKGLITPLEHMEALATGMEREAERLAEDTREKLGLPNSVRFG